MKLIGQEEAYRRQASLPPERSKIPKIRAIAEQALAHVEQLGKEYLEDSNPVHVWQAIMNIRFASATLGRPYEFPPWVLAYLFSAADMIAGYAVTAPPSKVPTKKPFMSSTDPLATEERLEVAVAALGFTGRQGKNRFKDAHRERVWSYILMREEYWRDKKKLTAKAAAEKAAEEASYFDDRLLRSPDPVREILRERRARKRRARDARLRG